MIHTNERIVPLNLETKVSDNVSGLPALIAHYSQN